MGIHRFLRRNSVFLVTLLVALTGSQAALAASETSDGTVTVVFTASCDGATIISSKDISNLVVVLGEDGFHEFSEGVDFEEGLTKVTLAPDAGFEGMIETVYVNSGAERLGEVAGVPVMVGEPFHCGQPA